jgi:hypothetical protein
LLLLPRSHSVGEPKENTVKHTMVLSGKLAGAYKDFSTRANVDREDARYSAGDAVGFKPVSQEMTDAEKDAHFERLLDRAYPNR